MHLCLKFPLDFASLHLPLLPGQHPVEHQIPLHPGPSHHGVEQPAQVAVVRLFLELQALHVGQVADKLFGEAFSQSFRGVEVLHVQDLLVLVLLGLGFQLLPGQLALG